MNNEDRPTIILLHQPEPGRKLLFVQLKILVMVLRLYTPVTPIFSHLNFAICCVNVTR